MQFCGYTNKFTDIVLLQLQNVKHILVFYTDIPIFDGQSYGFLCK